VPQDMPEAIQDRYSEKAAHCYGCGRLNERGHHLKTYWEGEETVTRFTPPSYSTAFPGLVYGGLIASLIDCHGCATAAGADERAAGGKKGEETVQRFVTAALHVNYLRPTPLGPELEIRGRVKETSGRKVVVEATVSANGTVTARGEVVTVRMPETMGSR
jgi:acyl-coenzyme A thioesterase PaaI-like protein